MVKKNNLDINKLLSKRVLNIKNNPFIKDLEIQYDLLKSKYIAKKF